MKILPGGRVLADAADLRRLGLFAQAGARQPLARAPARRRQAALALPVTPPVDDGLPRRAQATVPYTVEAWSKNRAWRYRKSTGTHYLTPEARAAREMLARWLRINAETGRGAPGWPWPPRKWWLGIVVYRPDMKGDPANVMDGCADAAAKAIGCDDRWMALDKLDWALDPAAPRIEVTVWQE